MTTYTIKPRNRQRIVGLTIVSTLLAFLLLAAIRHSAQDQSSYSSLSFLVPSNLPSITTIHTAVTQSSPRDAAANTTLGFAQLLALSAGPSWRSRGLAAAADIAGLSITTPSQAPVTDDAIAIFQAVARSRNQKGPRYGSAKAWLAHIDLLRYIVASGWETSFILEDDADFDVQIKKQMQLISDNVRAYTSTPDNDDDASPYGTSWDVLWPGHCGSWINAEAVQEMRTFPDDTRVDTAAYGGWSKRFLRENLGGGLRAIHRDYQTVCSFGYGVTTNGARKIIELASADNSAEAFDVSLSNHCTNRRLNCLIVNPEVFYHYQPPAELGYVSQVRAGDGKGSPADEGAFESAMGSTANIANSARCKALFSTTCVAPTWEI